MHIDHRLIAINAYKKRKGWSEQCGKLGFYHKWADLQWPKMKCIKNKTKK